MLISVAALAQNRVIGRNGQLPWHLPGDMRHFREVTRGGVVIMGRSTYQSIGKPLPHRENWVLTSSLASLEGATTFSTLETLLEAAASHSQTFVIGGQQIYQQLLPHCRRQWLTEIETEVAGDTYYPEWDRCQWKILEERPGPPQEQHAYRFCLYERL